MNDYSDLESEYRISALNQCVICVLTPRCDDSLGPVCGCSEGPGSALPAELRVIGSDKELLIHLLSNLRAASRGFSLVEQNVQEKSD